MRISWFPLGLAVALFPLPGAADVFLFKMPSNNVVCSVGIESDSADIMCTIYERNGPPARPAPADCMSYWGHVFSMRDRGPVTMECTDFDASIARSVRDVAQYGQTGSWGGITCTSLQSGLECRNASGHGFRLSRAVQAVY